MGPKGSVAKHLPPLVMLPEEGKKALVLCVCGSSAGLNVFDLWLLSYFIQFLLLTCGFRPQSAESRAWVAATSCE